MQTDMHSSIVW